MKAFANMNEAFSTPPLLYILEMCSFFRHSDYTQYKGEYMYIIYMESSRRIQHFPRKWLRARGFLASVRIQEPSAGRQFK